MPSTFHGLSEAEVDSNTKISVRETARLQSIGDGQGFVSAVLKRVVQEKLVNVWDQKFYVIRDVIIVTGAKISDTLFNIDF